MKSVIIYLNSIEYIKENPTVVTDLYYILINHDAINTVTHTLAILTLICITLKDLGAKMVYNAALDYSEGNGVKIFEELVAFIDHKSIDIKYNALGLICELIRNTTKKKKQANIIILLNDVKLYEFLEKNAQVKSYEFQQYLNLYQELTNRIVKAMIGNP